MVRFWFDVSSRDNAVSVATATTTPSVVTTMHDLFARFWDVRYFGAMLLLDVPSQINAFSKEELLLLVEFATHFHLALDVLPKGFLDRFLMLKRSYALSIGILFTWASMHKDVGVARCLSIVHRALITRQPEVKQAGTAQFMSARMKEVEEFDFCQPDMENELFQLQSVLRKMASPMGSLLSHFADGDVTASASAALEAVWPKWDA